MEFKDYYKILGVKEDADLKEIKKTYRKMALKYHPDMNPDDGAEDKFKEVAEAYEVLKNAERRAEYDELRRYGGGSKRGFEPPPDWQHSGAYHDSGREPSGQNFSDFFNSVFGSSFTQSHHTDRHDGFAIKGQDAEIEVPVFLEDTLAQHSRKIEFSLPVYENHQIKHVNKILNVKIPMGVSDGERIRLKGQGGPSQGNGPSGDLYLHIRLVPHPLFDVQGHNLLLTVPISPWEAALGCKVTVPTLAGKVNLTISPNSQSGQKLRIKGKGLRNKQGSGDLLAILKIVVPTTSTEKINQLWQQMAELNDFDPRAEWSK